MTLLFSARVLQRVIFTCVVASCLALVFAVVRVRTHQEQRPPVSSAPMAVQGFRTALYDGEQLRLRIAGDSLMMSNMKIFGPFSLGFLHSLVGRNITVDTFRSADASPERLADSLPLERISTMLAGRQHGVRLGQVDLEPLRVIEHQKDRTTVILEAASCRTTLTGRFTCRDGVLRTSGTPVVFRELSYDDATGTLHTAP